MASAQSPEDSELAHIVDVSAPVHCAGAVEVFQTCDFAGQAKRFEKKEGMTVVPLKGGDKKMQTVTLVLIDAQIAGEDTFQTRCRTSFFSGFRAGCFILGMDSGL